MPQKIVSQPLLAGLCLLGSSLWLPAFANLPEKQIFNAGSHCVAWRTQKTMAMVSKQEVIGRSCNVSVSASKTADGKLMATIQVPIASFNSQEKDRDKEVLKILQASKQPVLQFSTLPLTAAQWQTMLSNGQGAVRGELLIGGKKYPLNSVAKVRKNGNKIEVYGYVRTSFSSLGMAPPVVGPGGSIAKVADYLELHYHLSSDKVKNMELVP